MALRSCLSSAVLPRPGRDDAGLSPLDSPLDTVAAVDSSSSRPADSSCSTICIPFEGTSHINKLYFTDRYFFLVVCTNKEVKIILVFVVVSRQKKTNLDKKRFSLVRVVWVTSIIMLCVFVEPNHVPA